MQEKLTEDKKWMNTTFLTALKKTVANGDLIQNKNSYKLSATITRSTTKKSIAAASGAGPKKSKKIATAFTTISSTNSKKQNKADTCEHQQDHHGIKNIVIFQRTCQECEDFV